MQNSETPQGDHAAMQRVLRKAKKNPRKLARKLARDVYDYSLPGLLVRVSHPKAVKALEKAFTFLFQNNGEPHMRLLEPEVAKTFPNGRKPDWMPESARSWLAVGLDPQGRVAHIIHHTATPEARDFREERAVAERLVMAELRKHCSTAGIPPRGERSSDPIGSSPS